MKKLRFLILTTALIMTIGVMGEEGVLLHTTKEWFNCGVCLF